MARVTPMSDLAVVTEPASLAVVEDQCLAVELWAEQTDDVAAIKDAGNKLAAIDEYLARTTSEGRGRIAAAQRRLEVRIGKLIGPASTGRPSAETSVATELSKDERHAFRKLAEHEDKVEQALAESTDKRPASRRSVLNRIKQAAKDRRNAEDAALDAEIERLGLEKDDPETARRNKDASQALGAVRSAVEAVQRASRGLGPVDWALTYRQVGHFRAARLPLDEMESAGRWLLDTANEIK
jgi:hypothetical protein